MLSRDQILSSSDLSHEMVSVPEWGGSVAVWTVTGDEISEWENSVSRRVGSGDKIRDSRGIKSALLVLCLKDESGKRIFSDDDIEMLGGKSAKVINRLWDAATRMNGIGKETQEELEKNLNDAHRNGSGTS